MDVAKEALATQIDDAEWGWLRAHLERGGLIVVSPDLDLAETGWRITTDDTAAIGACIAGGKLGKPSREQIDAWDNDRTRTFRMLIASPYILIQEKQPAKGDSP